VSTPLPAQQGYGRACVAGVWRVCGGCVAGVWRVYQEGRGLGSGAEWSLGYPSSTPIAHAAGWPTRAVHGGEMALAHQSGLRRERGE
jgi:hypothetical protein